MVWSATGFALLTKCTENEMRALCTRTNAEAPPGSRASNQSGPRKCRANPPGRLFLLDRLVTPGAGSIAVPLPDSIDGRDRALTVAVSGVLDEIARREKDIIALLHDVVQRYLSPPPSV